MSAEIIAVLTLVVLRVGLPVVVILGVSYLVYRWIGDSKESSAGVSQRVALGGPAPIARVLAGPHCWDAKGCTAEMKANCAAAARPELPCWLAVQMKTGHLNKSCPSCGFYEQPSIRA